MEQNKQTPKKISCRDNFFTSGNLINQGQGITFCPKCAKMQKVCKILCNFFCGTECFITFAAEYVLV